MPDETSQAKVQAAGHAPESHPKDPTLAEASKPSTFYTVRTDAERNSRVLIIKADQRIGISL
jgi:hypothetical protein